MPPNRNLFGVSAQALASPIPSEWQAAAQVVIGEFERETPRAAKPWSNETTQGWNLARAYAPLPEAEIDRIERLFERVFAGDAEPRDLEALARRYDCRVVVVTPADGAWTHDPFASSGRYRRVEEDEAKWRIYRAAE